MPPSAGPAFVGGRAFWLTLSVLCAVTGWFGRDVLARPATSVLNDSGDPILTAMFMWWNASHLPFTDAWWQFPGFYHTRDVLAFSEHLLGLTPLSTPLAWMTGDPLVTYNLVMLLTFPLGGATMYLLVRQVTASAPAAGLAAVAFAFAPYRMSALAHVQMQAVFWLPLALLGLHAFLDDGRRRWLALYGAGWLLAALSNGYLLVTGSALIGLWVLWFVVARARWRDLGWITLATCVAAVPLVPILYRYVVVQAFQGLTRELAEVRMFSADAFSLFCAAPGLTVWGWLGEFCMPEARHFPGAALVAACAAGLAGVVARPGGAVRPWTTRERGFVWLGYVCLMVAVVYAGLAVAVVLSARPRLDVGLIRASAGSVGRYGGIALAACVAAVLVSPALRAAARRMGVVGFYLSAAVVMWLLSLGPVIVAGGRDTGWPGPYAALLSVPGMSGIRAPGRFWMMSVLCLVVATAWCVAYVLRGRPRRIVAPVVVILGAGLLSDGWVDRFIAAEPPFPAPAPRELAGGTVLELPMGSSRDVGPLYRAMMGGWTPVNGYSGYMPLFYANLAQAVKWHDDGLFDAFRAGHDLHVIVGNEDPELHTLTARQPGARVTGRHAQATQYFLPRAGAVPQPVKVGDPLTIARLTASCNSDTAGAAADGDPGTYWVCGPRVDGRWLTADLGAVQRVSSLVHGLDRQAWQAPRTITVETSLDGTRWSEAWRGNTVSQAVLAAMAAPTTSDLVVAFPSRDARYVRLTNGTGGDVYWFVTELTVLGGAAGTAGR